MERMAAEIKPTKTLPRTYCLTIRLMPRITISARARRSLGNKSSVVLQSCSFEASMKKTRKGTNITETTNP